MKKETYQNNNVIIEVRRFGNGVVDYWIQCGQAGLMLSQDDLIDLNEIVTAACLEIRVQDEY